MPVPRPPTWWLSSILSFGLFFLLGANTWCSLWMCLMSFWNPTILKTSSYGSYPTLPIFYSVFTYVKVLFWDSYFFNLTTGKATAAVAKCHLPIAVWELICKHVWIPHEDLWAVVASCLLFCPLVPPWGSSGTTDPSRTFSVFWGWSPGSRLARCCLLHNQVWQKQIFISDVYTMSNFSQEDSKEQSCLCKM